MLLCKIERECLLNCAQLYQISEFCTFLTVPKCFCFYPYHATPMISFVELRCSCGHLPSTFSCQDSLKKAFSMESSVDGRRVHQQMVISCSDSKVSDSEEISDIDLGASLDSFSRSEDEGAPSLCNNLQHVEEHSTKSCKRAAVPDAANLSVPNNRFSIKKKLVKGIFR